MARSSFIVAVQQAARDAERRRERRQAQETRERVARQRELERLRKEAERAKAQAARAAKADQVAADREAAQRHIAARQGEADALNAELAEQYAQLDQILVHALAADHAVSWDQLLRTVEHPPFELSRLEPAPPAPPVPAFRPEPVYQAPPAPSGLSAAFGGKKRYEAALAEADAAFARQVAQWREECARLEAEHRAALEAWGTAQTRRRENYERACDRYDDECRRREEEVAAHNAHVQQLRDNVTFEDPDAIREFAEMVLARSVYPDVFPVEHAVSCDPATREVVIATTVPPSDGMPTIKEHHYVRTRDHIEARPLILKDQKERYASAVHQTALRTLHEVFTADENGRIRTISLTVSAPRLSPATGRPEFTPLVRVAAERDQFRGFDLANVVPEATLRHLGASLSRSAYDLIPADLSPGVRTRELA